MHDGHWYTTSTPIRGAHCTPDGRPIGIFCAPDRAMVPAVDDQGNQVVKPGPKRPARIVIQAPDGHDLFEWDMSNPHQPVQQLAVFPVSVLQDLRPLVEADHLPEARRAHLPAGLQLVDPDAPESPILMPDGFDRFLVNGTETS